MIDTLHKILSIRVQININKCSTNKYGLNEKTIPPILALLPQTKAVERWFSVTHSVIEIGTQN